VTEVVPGELVERRGGEVETVVAQRLLDGGQRAAEACAHPAVGDRQLRRLAGRRGRLLADRQRDEARRVPQLVAEIAVAGDPPQIGAQGAGPRSPPRRGKGTARG